MNRKKTLTSAQGRAGSGFAKALSMLALLLTMAAGAWAQGSGTKIYSVDFSDYTSYTFYNGSESATVENGLLVLTNSKVYTEKYEVQPEIGRPTPITAGKCYRVTIEYKTTVGGPVNVVLGAQDWSTMMGAWWVPITVSDNFQTLEATFLKCSYGATDNHILFQFGDLVGTVYIKKVEVYEFDYVNVTSVTLSSSTASVNMGDKVALTATVAPDGATEKIVKWSVGGTNADAVKLYTDEACTTEVGADATSALTVYAKGMSAGEATVTVVASSDETKSATCTVTVNPTYAITFNALNANTIEGENGKGTVTVTESDGTTAYTGATLDENGNYKPLYEGQKITMTAAAGYKLKSVTAVPTGGINGKFSISATKQVYFSKGNLQATYDGSTWSWDFAKNQWDYIGADNNKVNGNGSVSSNCTIDVFGWSTSSNNFGIHNSKTDGDYSGDFVDWGTAIGSGWRTLTHDEWNFLLQSRTTTSGLLFAKANLFGTVHGLILFPDNYTHPDGLAAITAPNDATGNAGWNGNQYTAEEWAKMEAAGAVFLPAAGCREGTTNHNFNVIGYYHTATPADANNSYDVAFHASVLEFDWNQPNHWAFSVRLVNGLEVTLNDDKTEAKFAMPGNDVTVNYTLVRDMSVQMTAQVGDGEDGYRLRIKKNAQDVFEPADMEFEDMLALFTVTDEIEQKSLTFFGQTVDCNLSVYAVDENDQPTGDAIAFADLVPGRYVVMATAATGSEYDGQTAPSNIFELSNKFTLTFDPAPVEKVDVTVDGQAATPAQDGKLENVPMDKQVKVTAKTGYKLKKVKVKKTPTQQQP